MEKTKKFEEKITQYALIIFAILVLLIIYTFFTMQSTQTSVKKTALTTSPPEKTQDQQTQAPKPKSSETQAVMTKASQQVAPTITSTIKTAKKQEKTTEMKADDYKIPRNKQKKLTELLPKELKESIQASLPSEAELKAMTPEERAKFKETQKKLAVILRDIGHTEAENQQLQRSLNSAEVKKEKLDNTVEALNKAEKQ